MFFTDTDDFKKYTSVSKALKFEELTVFLKDVDRSILKKYLGAAFLAELQTAFDAKILAVAAPTAEQTKIRNVLELIRICTPHFALAKWAPFGQLNIDNAGISISTSENRKTAFQWQIKELVSTLNNTGTAALDDLLAFLDENIDDYLTYKESAEFASNRELFVHSSSIFERHYSAINGSRVTFFKLKSIIRKVEDFEIKAVLHPDYYAELKAAIKSGEAIAEKDQDVIDLVQPAVVNLTIARAVKELSATLTDDGFLQFDNTSRGETIESKGKADNSALIRMAMIAEADGRMYLKQLLELLESDATIYTTYAADATLTEEEDFENPNDGESNIYNAL